MPGPMAATTVFIIGVLNSCSWLSVEQEQEQEKNTRFKKHTKYVGNNADLWEYVIILYPLEEFFMYVFGC